MAANRKDSGYLNQLLNFDRQVRSTLPEAIIGIDEVGRGCLAGPVVAAAVCLPPIKPRTKLSRQLARLRDSKQLSAREREELATVIQEVSAYAICQASVEEIDELNILHASLLAMKRARQAIKAVPQAVLLIDGNMSIAGLSDPQITIIKGDSQSGAIAAASVIAKVFRDALMCRLAQFFPQYCWQQNKGYGSQEHRQAIKLYGTTPWHRKSFVQPKLADCEDAGKELLRQAKSSAVQEQAIVQLRLET